ncbi:TetR/AcrR family transcriptional regulator (plasmid) [Streptomyces sp. BI20]|uniref:TetR/AcrR family transcriptional regulator n=1 Tax=Streptomyces sp. BI20 TaxID=3403460 RepID=UPI003C7612F6
MSENLRELPLRERKKLRTRRALSETALRLFTERGYDATTLDELCDLVEVSKRTFFRTYRSKEDVALAADSDLWSAYLGRTPELDAGRPLLEALRELLESTLAAMDPDWERRFLATRRLADGVPALRAHSLGYCQDTTRALVEAVSGEPEKTGDGGAGDGAGGSAARIRRGLTVEVFVAAWRTASSEWTAAGGRDGRAGLARWIDAAFAELGAVLPAGA